jgi:serine phosphatase RsbU (regulator of sigma subunit)
VEAVETDLRIASKIQADALPPAAPEFADHPELCIRGCMNTAKEVGGDFYDYFPIDDDRICFLIADVSGKGTPAALFMMTAKTVIKDYALTRDSTAEIFTAVNKRLCENNAEGMFATAWIGILDTRTMMLQYTNAGHNYPILKRKGRPCELMKTSHGLFLAGLDFTSYSQSSIRLEPGDRLLLYTDGATEAHDSSNKLYGTERLERMLENCGDLPDEQLLDSILEDLYAFAEGVPQFDDITMVVITLNAPATYA